MVSNSGEVIIKYERKYNQFFFSIFFWKRKIKEVHTHSEDSVRRVFRSIAQNGFDYYGESVPYGRAKWFIESEQEFYNEFSNTEFEYFGYSPVRSLKEEDFTEYGFTLNPVWNFRKNANQRSRKV